MIEGTVKSTAHHDAVHELPKLTALVDGKRRIVRAPADARARARGDHPDRGIDAGVATARRLQEDRRVLLDRYAITDYALKVVGVGSVGPGRLRRRSSTGARTTTR